MRQVCVAFGALALVSCADGGKSNQQTLDEGENVLLTDDATKNGAAAPDDEVSITLGSSAAPTAKAAACTGEEQTIFACRVEGGKSIAVCGKDGEVEYRFGNQTPEMAIKGGRFASVPYSGGGEAQIAFSNGSTRYIVFSRTIRTNFAPGEPNDPEFTDGVMIVRNEELLSQKHCKAGDVQSVDVNSSELYGGAASELFFVG